MAKQMILNSWFVQARRFFHLLTGKAAVPLLYHKANDANWYKRKIEKGFIKNLTGTVNVLDMNLALGINRLFQANEMRPLQA